MATTDVGNVTQLAERRCTASCALSVSVYVLGAIGLGVMGGGIIVTSLFILATASPEAAMGLGASLAVLGLFLLSVYIITKCSQCMRAKNPLSSNKTGMLSHKDETENNIKKENEP